MYLKSIFIILIALLISSSIAFALTYTSPNYTLKNAKIVVSGGEATSSNYSLDDVLAGNIIGGKAESTNYSLDASNIDNIDRRTKPNPPTLDPVISPTVVPVQTLTGTKDRGTSIYINGYEAVPLSSDTTWSYDQSLNEGENHLITTARNGYGLGSEPVYAAITLDTTPPSTPVVTDDGETTSSLTELHASWSAEDLGSGIAKYKYGIGTTAGGVDIVGWTSAGTQTEVTHRGLNLVNDQTYYFTVKAKDGVGYWSEVGNSDGITVQQTPPQITGLEPADGSTFYKGDTITIAVTATDAEGDPLEYQFSIDGTVHQDWDTASTYSWQTSVDTNSLHRIQVEARDAYESDSEAVEIYLFRRPIGPPQ